MTDIKALIGTLKELGEKATPGPWIVKPQRGYPDNYILTGHPDFVPDQSRPHRNYVGECGLAGGQTKHYYPHDSALIVALRNALPTILAALERGEKCREAASDALKFIDGQMRYGQPSLDSGEEPLDKFTFDAEPICMALSSALEGQP